MLTPFLLFHNVLLKCGFHLMARDYILLTVVFVDSVHYLSPRYHFHISVLLVVDMAMVSQAQSFAISHIVLVLLLCLMTLHCKIREGSQVHC